MYLSRVIPLEEEITRKSIFLFGPRQTGKTTLLKHSFPKAQFYNLRQYLHLMSRKKISALIAGHI
jgi:predicted AAA+ superfamily ATPase